MTSLRKRKAAISWALVAQHMRSTLEDRLWDQMRPVGREFGSPDFERLMEEDRRKGSGIFDPALKGMYSSSIEIPEDMPVQSRKPL